MAVAKPPSLTTAIAMLFRLCYKSAWSHVTKSADLVGK